MSGPLTGVRVVELCDELGQYAGKLLADMGADVVKIEPPEGSAARRVGPFVNDEPGPERSLNFWYHNANKRSVMLDLAASETDRGLARALIARADVFLEAGSPGRAASLGLERDALAAANPRLVHCALTPFGQDGPWAGYAVSDLVALAAGGPMCMNGYDAGDAPGAPPIHGKGDQAYNTAAHYAVMGILTALFARETTGAGQFVDCAMHEALSSTTEVGLPHWLYGKRNVIRQTGRHAALFRTEPWIYRARDGLDVLAYSVGRSNESWARLKAWMQSRGFGANLDEARFDDPVARQGGRGGAEAGEIMAEVARFVAAHDAAEVYRGAQACGLPWGVVRAPDETLDDAHLHDRGHFAPITGEGLEGSALMPGAPCVFGATPWELRRPAPRLGEHTDEVLAELRGA